MPPKEHLTRHPIFYHIIECVSLLLRIRDIGKIELDMISVFMNFIISGGLKKYKENNIYKYF